MEHDTQRQMISPCETLALKQPQKKYGPNSQFWYPLKSGMESLPKGFLPYVKNIHLNAEATNISISNRIVTINDQKEVTFNKLIIDNI